MVPGRRERNGKRKNEVRWRMMEKEGMERGERREEETRWVGSTTTLRRSFIDLSFFFEVVTVTVSQLAK